MPSKFVCLDHALILRKTRLIHILLNKPTDNKLQTDSKKKVSPSDIANYYYLDAQAKMIIKLYGSGIAAFEVHADALKAHQANIGPSGDLANFTSHPSYNAIVAMGKDQVAPFVMAEYVEDQDGCWHELLHELEYGEKSGATTFDKPALYQQWKMWFESSGRETEEA